MASRTALLIAFQFPPMRGSSAIQRTMRFAQHLPKFGWAPVVLTATPHTAPVARSCYPTQRGAFPVGGAPLDAEPLPLDFA